MNLFEGEVVNKLLLLFEAIKLVNLVGIKSRETVKFQRSERFAT